MSAPAASGRPRTSRRALLQGAAVLGLSAASSPWLRPATALAAPAADIHSAARPPLLSAGHLVTDYRPSQPTGWPPEQGRLRDGAGVTIGGHVAAVPFTVLDTPYEISLLAFGQTASAPDPVYESEPSDPVIDFKATLEKAWSAYYSFRYRGGFSGRSAISVQSYSVEVTEPTASHPQLSYGADLFMVYEHDPSSSDPPTTADLRWIEVSNSGGTSSTEFAQRANPLLLPWRAHVRLRQAGVQLLRRPRGRHLDQRKRRRLARPLSRFHGRELPRTRHRAKGQRRQGNHRHLRRRQMGLANPAGAAIMSTSRHYHR